MRWFILVMLVLFCVASCAGGTIGSSGTSTFDSRPGDDTGDDSGSADDPGDDTWPDDDTAETTTTVSSTTTTVQTSTSTTIQGTTTIVPTTSTTTTISASWDDPGSGLTWQVTPAADMYGSEAVAYCEGLVLAGHNDWRLPNIDELRSLVRGCPATEPDGSCNVTGTCLYIDCKDATCYMPCPWELGPANGCYGPWGLQGCDTYWSSSPVLNYPDPMLWILRFGDATIGYGGIVNGHGPVRCVEG